MRRRRFVLLLLCGLSVSAGGAGDDIEVSGAWVSEAPPGTGVAAAYLEIRNSGKEPVILAGAAAPRFKRVEIHRSEVRDGIAGMRLQQQVPIPPGTTLRFAPGGYHLMLFRDPPLPRAGDTVGLTLRFGDGTTLAVEAPVRRPGAGDTHSH